MVSFLLFKNKIITEIGLGSTLAVVLFEKRYSTTETGKRKIINAWLILWGWSEKSLVRIPFGVLQCIQYLVRWACRRSAGCRGRLLAGVPSLPLDLSVLVPVIKHSRRYAPPALGRPRQQPLFTPAPPLRRRVHVMYNCHAA